MTFARRLYRIQCQLAREKKQRSLAERVQNRWAQREMNTWKHCSWHRKRAEIYFRGVRYVTMIITGANPELGKRGSEQENSPVDLHQEKKYLISYTVKTTHEYSVFIYVSCSRLVSCILHYLYRM